MLGAITNQQPNGIRAEIQPARHGVNLGSFYGPSNAVSQSPIFAQQPLPKIASSEAAEPLHVALVKIRAPQSLDDLTLKDVGLILSQLNQLGLHSVVVIDCTELGAENHQSRGPEQRSFVFAQSDRVVASIDAHPGPGARRVDNAIGVSLLGSSESATGGAGDIHITFRSGLVHSLRRGVIPVLAPVGHFTHSQKAVYVQPDELMIALTKELAGISIGSLYEGDPRWALEHVKLLQKDISLDRIIVLDPLGGIPSKDPLRSTHVFINMEQEYYDIRNELQRDVGTMAEDNSNSKPSGHSANGLSRWSTSSGKVANVLETTRETHASNPSAENLACDARHLQNLTLLQRALALLPTASSALLTTPVEAAKSGKPISAPFQATGVGTRRQRNALIHNLLTDKPAFSSSLPTGRLSRITSASNAGSCLKPVTVPATFMKRGMPLTIVPDPRTQPWTSPSSREQKITLHDPRLDLSRLVDLIEDSFNRKLDVEHYLTRVNDKIAGVIIAGEYEGGALLTWEMPSYLGQNDKKAAQHPFVPYLDKFAVRKRSQGAGGVADIVFSAMVRGCFPEGVCWRSRKDNPVNKWYFERARGTWKLPDSNWTMFWTTDNVSRGSTLFLDYESVCRSIEPSWADNKHVAD